MIPGALWVKLSCQWMTQAQWRGRPDRELSTHPFEPWVFTGVGAEQATAIGRHPRPVGTLGLVAQQGQTLRTCDVRQHPAFQGFPLHPPDVTSLLGVPIHFRGVNFGNLYLGNKVDAPTFTPKDPAPIIVYIRSTDEGIEVAVEDQGIGIPAEDVPLLFDRFYQSRRARERKTGLGLGLYIRKGLVDAHGGRLWLESQSGNGSVFHAWFPGCRDNNP